MIKKVQRSREREREGASDRKGGRGWGLGAHRAARWTGSGWWWEGKGTGGRVETHNGVDEKAKSQNGQKENRKWARHVQPSEGLSARVRERKPEIDEKQARRQGASMADME